MSINLKLEQLEIQLRIEALKEFNETAALTRVSQMECTWDEVKE